MEYRVLTLREPWASLVVYGHKKIETRPKPTKWTAEKGTYLIHAAKKWTKEQYNLCDSEPFSACLAEMDDCGIRGQEWAFGHIIGSVEVKECIEIEEHNTYSSFGVLKVLRKGKTNHSQGITHHFDVIKEPELSFGDYTEGRYAWMLENPRILETPIPYKGGQGYYQRFKGDESLLKFKSWKNTK